MTHRSEMDVGEFWAYRARVNDMDCPVLKAEILQFAPRHWIKVRVRWHSGEFDGLDEWVPTIRLRVRWDDVEAWQREERLLEAAAAASEGTKGTLPYEAAEMVINIYRPDAIMLDWPRHTEALYISTPDLIAADLGVTLEWLLAKPLSFIGRDGVYHAPSSVAKDIVDLIIKKNTKHVLAAIQKEENEEREYATRGKYTDYGHIEAEFYSSRFFELEPVFALVREWCGAPTVHQFDEVTALRKEVKELRTLLLEAAGWLKDAGHPVVAARLRKRVGEPEGRKQSRLRQR